MPRPENHDAGAGRKRAVPPGRRRGGFHAADATTVLCPSCHRDWKDTRTPCPGCGFSWVPSVRRSAVVGAALMAAGIACVLWLLLGGGPEDLWTHKTRRIVTSPVVGQGRVVFATSDRALLALDAASGEVVWQHVPEVSYIVDGVVVSDGMVYFVDAHKVLHAVRLDDGGVAWTYRTRSSLSAPVIGGDRLVITAGGNVLVFDKRTGEEIDDIEIDRDHVLGDPALAGSTLLCGFSQPEGRRLYPGIAQDIGGGAYAIDLDLREPRWLARLDYLVRRAPVVSGDLVYFTEHNGAAGSTHALAAARGDRVWGQKGAATAVVLAGDVICHGHLDPAGETGELRAFDARTGRPVWTHGFSFETPLHMRQRHIEPLMSDPVAGRGRIYFGCINELHCVDADTGQGLWRRPLSGRITRRPTLSNGRLFVATSSGRLYALDVE